MSGAGGLAGRRKAGVFGAGLAWIFAAGLAQGGVLSRVAAVQTAAGLEIHITVGAFFDSRLFLLENPNRIVLDISGVGENAAAPQTDVNEAGVRSIRTAQFTADMVRIVLDLQGEVPTYQFSRTGTGFLIVFPRASAAEPPVTEIIRPEPVRTSGAPAKTEAVPPPDNLSERTATPVKKAEVLNPPPAPIPPPGEPGKISFRLTAAADLLLFRDASLAAAYGRAANFGARLDVALLEFGGLWLGADYYGRTAADAATGGTRNIQLIPIEAGVKFRMTRGTLVPYIGFGAAFFLFREETPSGIVSLNAFGLTSTAGLLLRLGRRFVADAYVRYKRLPVDLAVRSFDAGGFHFGGGIAFEFY